MRRAIRMTGILSGRLRPVALIFENLVNAPKSALAMMTDRVKGPKSSRVEQADCKRLVPSEEWVIHACA
jgi:hypothetical protein